VGIHPLYLREQVLGGWTERALDCGVHRHTGLALLPSLPPGAVRAARRLAMTHLHRTARRLGVDRVHLNAQNLAPRNLCGQREEVPFWVADHGYQLGMHFGPAGPLPVPGMSTCCADQVVALAGLGEEHLFRGLEEGCRRAVRKAQKKGLEARVADGPDAAAEYYRLARLSSTRTGEHLLPLSYYEALYARLAPEGRCCILLAVHEERPVAGLLLLVDKGAAHFLAGASDPAALPLRPNDFVHWSAIRWAASRGLSHYRLGPTFPELPRDWPVARVSRFKGKFGGRSLPMIQGSRFLRPERYGTLAAEEAARLCRADPELGREDEVAPGVYWLGDPDRDGLEQVLQAYGVLAGSLHAIPPTEARRAPIVIVTDAAAAGPLGLRVRREPGGKLYRPPGGLPFLRPSPAYHALLEHVTFAGEGLEPVWVDAAGRAVAAWQERRGSRRLLVGLDVAREIVRHRQGDPAAPDLPRTASEFERTVQRFERQLVPGRRTQPWADRLGFLLAESWSRTAGMPLLEVLPGGARGALAVTGDDDQAALDRYEEQHRLLDGLPITYFLHPLTRHRPETLAALGPHVEIGVHPDALEEPSRYRQLCGEQTAFVRKLSGRPARIVRNHGFLSSGYLGHLEAWEESVLRLDTNCPGLDGTALNGSYLPMRTRRADGTWSDHYNLLTAFGDGMLYVGRLSESQAIRRVRRLVDQVEKDLPAVLVFNLHPENVADTTALHREVIALRRRPGWIPLGLESYLEWLDALNGLRLYVRGGRRFLNSRAPVGGIVLRVPGSRGWLRRALPPWSGPLELPG